jgi:CrcB protein
MLDGHSYKTQFIAVGAGAALGSLLRWVLSLVFNGVLDVMPLGTLMANCLGGFLIGISIALFEHHDDLPPAVRLFYVTGFLGGLTTFSTFSGEAVASLSGDSPAHGIALILAHLLGSLLLTAMGIRAGARLVEGPRNLR